MSLQLPHMFNGIQMRRHIRWTSGLVHTHQKKKDKVRISEKGGYKAGKINSYSIKTSVQKWFGLKSLAAVLLSLGCNSNIFSSYVIYHCHLLVNGCKELFFRSVAIPLIDSCLCSFLTTVEAPFEHSAAGKCHFSTNCRCPTMNIWQFNTFFVQKPHGPTQPMIITFHSEIFVHVHFDH